ncbi:toll/interleukin-1 receptor domain-containing protein [Roseixanthobacter glucoisosaccharinicivorans]|uniref:toll/interleukin-1 receptor domain-containing protein n=1 Tax=Roseixanthobacter glucoisosaccharinicivorans TaxID=3119923 RepID=UPI00372CA194
MAVPLSLTGKYQLVVLGQEGNPQVSERAGRLVAAVAHAFDKLGVNPKKFLVSLTSGHCDSDINRRMPAVAVFFGSVPSPVLSVIDTKRLEILLGDGALVIPVVESITNFGTMVTPEVATLNGCSLADCGSDFERLAARILEGFGLLREKRRLFISYRRVESSGVATQLYEALDAAGFDVFLDTQGVIRPGEPFQEILWHRLADTDVAVLLDTPGFLASRWTEEELARANTSNIQLLQILWPGQTEGATAAFSAFHPLSEGDFAGSNTLGPGAQLKDVEVSEIVDAVEGLRARAFGARHAFLVREFAIEARHEGMQVLTTLERNLILSAAGGFRALVMPAIGVPDAERYESLGRLHQRDLDEGKAYAQPPILLYDQTGIRSRWLQHLGWLNDNIACARSLSIVDAKKWLSDLKAASGI